MVGGRKVRRKSPETYTRLDIPPVSWPDAKKTTDWQRWIVGIKIEADTVEKVADMERANKQALRDQLYAYADSLNPDLSYETFHARLHADDTEAARTILAMISPAKTKQSSSPAIDPGMFCRGYCAEFAIALHEKTGWPLYVFNEIRHDPDMDEDYESFVHYVVKTPSGKYADVRGLRTEKQIAANLLDIEGKPLTRYKLRKTTAEDAEAETFLEDSAMEMAEEYIDKHPTLWKEKK